MTEMGSRFTRAGAIVLLSSSPLLLIRSLRVLQYSSLAKWVCYFFSMSGFKDSPFGKRLPASH